MTADAIIQEIRANIKRTSDGVSDSRIMQWVNWSQGQVADWHTYEEMRKKYTANTVDGQKSYGFPTNTKDIYSLTLQDGASSKKLIYVHPREFDTKVPRPEQTTERSSTYYLDYGVNFELYPIPGKTYVLNLRCSVYPTDFSLATTSSSSTLLRKDALISAVATMFGFLSLREIEDATYWKNEIAAPLYQASLSSDHSSEDWCPQARGFSTGHERVGEYWSNPLVRSMP